MKNEKKRFLAGRMAAALIVATAGVVGSAHAATITLNSTGSFANDSVLILPTGGYAVDFGNTTSSTTTGSSAGATTGVTFEGGPAATAAGTFSSSTTGTSPDVTISLPTGSGTAKIGSSTSYLSTTTVPTLATARAPVGGTADTNFGTLAGNGEFASANTGVLQIAMNNLTIGDQYEFQVFLVDGRTTGGTSAIYQSASDIANSVAPIGQVAIHYADGATIGGYVLASFVADAASQSFYVQTFSAAAPTTGGGGNIQALVLQDQGVPAAAPEPASLGVLAIGAAGLLARRRR